MNFVIVATVPCYLWKNVPVEVDSFLNRWQKQGGHSCKGHHHQGYDVQVPGNYMRLGDFIFNLLRSHPLPIVHLYSRDLCQKNIAF